MSYAIWIALAVVLIAIGPALVRNLRNAGKRGSSSDTTGGSATGASDRDDDGGDGTSDGGASDGGD